MSQVVLVAATVGNGLLGGLFFAFACAVTRGLRHVGDLTYVTSFRAVNAAILGGWFLVVFFGTPLATTAAVVLHSGGADRDRLPWLLVGLAGAIGTALVTAVVNVPLNRRLDAAPVRTDAECAVARRRFESRWNRWNLVRTVTSTAALTCLAAAAAV